MLVPLLILELVAKVAHAPLLLLRQVAVIVWPSASLQITCNDGVTELFVLPFVGDSPLCVGITVVVK